jgi:hypothetical protein
MTIVATTTTSTACTHFVEKIKGFEIAPLCIIHEK